METETYLGQCTNLLQFGFRVSRPFASDKIGSLHNNQINQIATIFAANNSDTVYLLCQLEWVEKLDDDKF